MCVFAISLAEVSAALLGSRKLLNHEEKAYVCYQDPSKVSLLS